MTVDEHSSIVKELRLVGYLHEIVSISVENILQWHVLQCCMRHLDQKLSNKSQSTVVLELEQLHLI